MHARKSQPHPIEKSRALQRRLYRAAKRSGSRRFHALYDRIVRPDVLWRAWVEVRANQGAPGVDGVRIEDVERCGVEGYLEELAAEDRPDLRPRRHCLTLQQTPSRRCAPAMAQVMRVVIRIHRVINSTQR